MASCDHIACLRHVENAKTGEIVLEDPGRFRRVIDELPRPDQQTPLTTLFLGTRAKDAALKQIFMQNNIGRRGESGNINLRVETVSSTSPCPLFILDSNPFALNQSERSHVLCHETVSYTTRWTPDVSTVLDILYSRFLFLFSDTVCVFADDFACLDDVLLRLMIWARIGSAAQPTHKVRPRLLIIISENRCMQGTEYDRFQATLRSGLDAELAETFSAIKIFHLAGEYLSPLARHQRLRDEIRSQNNEMLRLRQDSRSLFSASHLSAFFGYAVQHTARTISHNFDFIAWSRVGNEVKEDYLSHLTTFLEIAVARKTPYETVASFIASSILMDAYPPRMHRSYQVPSLRPLANVVRIPCPTGIPHVV